jgi:PadR family transcriptional regulator, regulatory protein PadR
VLATRRGFRLSKWKPAVHRTVKRTGLTVRRGVHTVFPGTLPGRAVGDDLELVQGTLDVLVLKTLSWGPRHGYAVARWIHDTSREELRVEDRALYVSLHRLEARGWVESEWGLSDNNRKAKFYQLTSAGRKALREQAERWGRYAKAIDRVLRVT